MKKLLAWLLLVALLLVAASGCGAARKVRELEEAAKQLEELAKQLEERGGEVVKDLAGEEEEPAGEEEEPAEEEEEPAEEEEDPAWESEENGGTGRLFDGEVFYPADFVEVINTFQEFGCALTSVNKEGETSEWSMHYKVVGWEEVDGTEALHIMYTYEKDGESAEYELWFDDAWECVKALRNGAEVDIIHGSSLTMTVQNYATYAELTQEIIKADGTYEPISYKLEGRSSERADLGTGTVKINLFNMRNLWDPYTHTYGLAEIDGRLVYVVIKNSSSKNPKSDEMRVTHAVPY